MGAVLGPIAGLAMAPLSFVGAACALLSLVLACVEVQQPRAPAPTTSLHDRA